MSEDLTTLEHAVESLRELRDDRDAFAALGPRELVAIAKAAKRTIDAAVLSQQDSLREIGKIVSATNEPIAIHGVSNRDLSFGIRLAEIPDDEYEQIKLKSGLIRKAFRRIYRDKALARLADEDRKAGIIRNPSAAAGPDDAQSPGAAGSPANLSPTEQS